jgi:hypothetical protein
MVSGIHLCWQHIDNKLEICIQQCCDSLATLNNFRCDTVCSVITMDLQTILQAAQNPGGFKTAAVGMGVGILGYNLFQNLTGFGTPTPEQAEPDQATVVQRVMSKPMTNSVSSMPGPDSKTVQQMHHSILRLFYPLVENPACQLTGEAYAVQNHMLNAMSLARVSGHNYADLVNKSYRLLWACWGATIMENRGDPSSTLMSVRRLISEMRSEVEWACRILIQVTEHPMDAEISEKRVHFADEEEVLDRRDAFELHPLMKSHHHGCDIRTIQSSILHIRESVQLCSAVAQRYNKALY